MGIRRAGNRIALTLLIRSVAGAGNAAADVRDEALVGADALEVGCLAAGGQLDAVLGAGWEAGDLR